MATSFYKWLALPLFSMGLWFNGDHSLLTRNGGSATVHPIHISTVEINHNATDKSLEITCKIFWDDFESILTKKNNNKRVDLTNEKNLQDNNRLVAAYINSHLSITVDAKPLTLSFVGFEKEDVVVYSYLEVTNVTSLKNISINDNLMHDMFDDQTNIVHVIFNGNRKSTKLDYPATVAKIEF
jgi:hypothetical protein